MLKETLSEPLNDFIFPDNGNQVRLIRHYILHSAVGEIMSLIEMCGLPNKQEQPLKDAVKRVLWGGVWGDSYSYRIPEKIHDEIFTIVKKAIEDEEKDCECEG